ncbi:hypothetical protein BCY88_06610 [Paraburkholderia fungorum]|uniref:Uncharacterized protein n=1 Tax=Paraburkholderia fungorum TaxID=134537 RepID=A0A3R7ERR9_9BURK|nr:hypothetical protein BCY88_06610 [Paraburkholderia fungorum]
MVAPAACLQNRPEPALLQCVKGGRVAGWAAWESGLRARVVTTTVAACGTPHRPKDPPRIRLQSPF